MSGQPVVRAAGRVVVMAATTLLLAASSAAAQGAMSRQGGAPPPERARLEAQLRERVARVVQRQLRLDDAQMTRLRQTSRAYEERRRELLRREREVRTAIRAELIADSAADQRHVADLIDRAIGLQRERLDLLAAEQRDLARFLTPVQRARYLDLQDKLRRRVEELRRRDEAGVRGRPFVRGRRAPG